jgi:hypothetical protein
VNIDPEESTVQLNIEQSNKESRNQNEQEESADSSFSTQEGTGIELPGYSKAQKGSQASRNGKYDQVDSKTGAYFGESQFSSETAALMRERNFLEQRTFEW